MEHIAQGKRSDTLGFPHSRVSAPCKGKSFTPLYGMLLSGAGLTYGALNGTGWTNTILDVAGNQTRKDDGTPIFTVNRDFDDMSSNA